MEVAFAASAEVSEVLGKTGQKTVEVAGIVRKGCKS